ncbi:hypothetical protein DM860_004127 [Cuscuta australis]|uniref:E2 ubiquitin-conjugating enzyme n=1 Tax=Cuscuta australis TaxID=267555 RepID=A0A328CVD7_9ASTE|nr:hypothetical protein DM860_004127 [Cuscuta australis]
MAQAARLSLRMQREFKLLLSDPPPGAAFPSLCSSSSSSAAPSLSSIDAEIEGPEGSVYANGVFRLKIQIPERYPFHPPVVTFVTPIYHPNIDNGGRICLDILNLPPKGAWQPSLNISSVLTSIGLLLSEPNPDDGLMHDASKEYKYNMQAFYQKARSMTERFAMPRASEDGAYVSHIEIQTRTSPRTKKLQVDDRRPDAPSSYSIQSQNRLSGVSRKLSLDSSGSKLHKAGTVVVEAAELNHYKDSTNKNVNEITAYDDFDNHIEPEGLKRKRSTVEGVNGNPVQYPSDNQIESEYGMGSMDISLKQKQSLKHNDSKPQSGKELRTPSRPSDLPLPESASHPRMDTADRNFNMFTSMKHKRLGLSGRKMTLGSSRSSQSLQNNKENLISSSSFADSKANLHSEPLDLCAMSEGSDFYGHAGKSSAIGGNKLGGNLRRQPLQSKVHLQESDENNLQLLQKQHEHDREEKLHTNIKENKIEQPTSDDPVIVLDSEDSGDERRLPSRSKLSLTRKRWPMKQKFKA